MNYNDEKIDDVYKLANSIQTIYHKLYKLELNNQKDSAEYNKLIDYLTIALEVEEEYYQKNFISFDESNYFYIKIVDEMGKMDSDIDSIIKMNYNEETTRRILDKLRMKMGKAYDYIPRKNLKIQMKNDSILSSCVKLSNYVRTLIICSGETYETYLSFLQLFINKTKDEYYKNKLIRQKYYLSSISGKIEKKLLDNNFNILPVTIHNADFSACLNAIPYKEYFEAKDEYIFKEAYRQMFKLNKIKDVDYKTPSNGLVAISRLCFLKAFLLQMNLDDLINTERDFKKIINNQTNMKAFTKNNTSKKLLMQMFDDLEQDEKEKIIKIKY